MKQAAWVALAVLLWISPLLAEDSRVGFFVGYAYQRAHIIKGHPTKLNGWDAAAEVRVMPHLTIAADYMSSYGSTTLALPPIPICPITPCPTTDVTARFHRSQSLVGPRIDGSLGKARIFGHLLIGLGRLSGSGTLGSTFTNVSDIFGSAVGGGFDYGLKKRWAWRTQVDYSGQSFNSRGGDTRVLTGIVLRF